MMIYEVTVRGGMDGVYFFSKLLSAMGFAERECDVEFSADNIKNAINALAVVGGRWRLGKIKFRTVMVNIED